MNVSIIKTSHALRYAALLLVVLLGYLLLVRSDLLMGKVVSLPMLSHTPAVSYTDAAPAPLARTDVSNTGISPAPLALVDVSSNTGISPAPLASADVSSNTGISPAPLALADVSRNIGLSDADRSFFARAAKSGVQEDEVSRGALSHLVYPEVREYAYMILSDHTAAIAELKGLAARKGMVFPAPEKIAYRKWWKSGGSVDQHYINLMAEDNKEVVELFEKATESDDVEVATFARKTLPIFQNHLNTARDLKKVTE